MTNRAYGIVDVDILDLETYGKYMQRVGPALNAAGASYLVRGGTHRVLEGDWEPRRLVLVEFRSMDAARQFYASPEYSDCKDIRVACSSSNVVLVEGLDGISSNLTERSEQSKSAKGFVILDVKIHDIDRYQDFMQCIKPTIEAAGGRYLVRGGEHEVVEGEWDPDRLVIFEFPSVEKAEDFYFSDNYQNDSKKIRQECSTANLVVVEGFSAD